MAMATIVVCQFTDGTCRETDTIFYADVAIAGDYNSNELGPALFVNTLIGRSVSQYFAP